MGKIRQIIDAYKEKYDTEKQDKINIVFSALDVLITDTPILDILSFLGAIAIFFMNRSRRKKK